MNFKGPPGSLDFSPLLSPMTIFLYSEAPPTLFHHTAFLRRAFPAYHDPFSLDWCCDSRKGLQRFPFPPPPRGYSFPAAKSSLPPHLPSLLLLGLPTQSELLETHPTPPTTRNGKTFYYFPPFFSTIWTGPSSWLPAGSVFFRPFTSV